MEAGPAFVPAHAMPSAPAVRPADRAWLAVGLLCFLYAASFIDRMILAVLVDPVKADLGISDAQLGMLFGTGFAVFYSIAGLPLAHLADRGDRRRLLVTGVLLWSVATMLAGASTGFLTLMLSRAGVAIGEAVLMPVAVSMIADLFAKERRALPTSIFSTVGAVMGSGSLIVGGGALFLAIALYPVTGLAPWRLTFLLVALPGLIGAALFALFIAEPARGSVDRRDENAGTQAMILHLRDRAGLYLGLFVGVAFMLIQAMGLVAWGATILTRAHGFSGPAAGAAFGLAAMSGAMAGTLSVPLVLRWLGGGQSPRAIIQTAMLYAVLSAPLLALGIAASHTAIVLAAIAVGMAGLAAGAVLPPLLTQAVTPPRLRARVIAVYLLLNNLLSLGLGPVAIALLAARNADRGLAEAMALTGWLTLGVALCCYLVALSGTRSIDPHSPPKEDIS